MNLKDKVILISGAKQGMGLAIAKKLKDSSDKKQILSKEDAEKNAKLI